MWENAYLSIKNPKASRALKWALDPGHKLLASLARLRFTTSATFGLSTWGPLDQILDPHLECTTISRTLNLEDCDFHINILSTNCQCWHKVCIVKDFWSVISLRNVSKNNCLTDAAIRKDQLPKYTHILGLDSRIFFSTVDGNFKCKIRYMTLPQIIFRYYKWRGICRLLVSIVTQNDWLWTCWDNKISSSEPHRILYMQRSLKMDNFQDL